MTTKISTWGNSLGVRLPKDFIKAIALEAGSTVNIQLIGKKIIISPSEETLEEMVAKITPENSHEILLNIAPVGKEIW